MKFIFGPLYWVLIFHLIGVGIQKKPFFLFWYLNARPHLVLFINHSRRLVSARTNLNARVGKARKSGGDKQTFNDLPHDEAPLIQLNALPPFTVNVCLI